MQTPVKLKDRGFTIIELLIAFTILTISMLAILNSLVVTVDHNLRNLMRDEAVRIAEEKINELRGMPFSLLSDGEYEEEATKAFRNLSISYNVYWKISPFSSNSKNIDVKIDWSYKGLSHSYVATTLVSGGT